MKKQQPAPPHSAGAPPPVPEHLPCPRCSSTNTKFCYYNNYNFSQPRHFCKACRRYWTHGGTLRDVPVGGGTRKRHRPLTTAAAPPPPPPPEAGKPLYGSFTSLLGSAGLGSGFVNPFGGFGFGSGFVSPVWNFPVGDTWQMGSVGEGGECFALPELAISTPGFCLK